MVSHSVAVTPRVAIFQMSAEQPGLVNCSRCEQSARAERLVSKRHACDYAPESPKQFRTRTVEQGMHAILASLGTDGDVLPFIGLGVALRARGHRVTIVASGQYADLVASHWLEFRELVTSEKMRALLSNADVWHPLKAARHTADWGRNMIAPQYRLLTELAASNDSVLITNP